MRRNSKGNPKYPELTLDQCEGALLLLAAGRATAHKCATDYRACRTARNRKVIDGHVRYWENCDAAYRQLEMIVRKNIQRLTGSHNADTSDTSRLDQTGSACCS